MPRHATHAKFISVLFHGSTVVGMSLRSTQHAKVAMSRNGSMNVVRLSYEKIFRV